MSPLLGAIELGGSKVLCAVGHAHDRVLHQGRVETRDAEATLSLLAEEARGPCVSS